MPLDDLYNKITALQEFDIAEETIDIINKNKEVIKNLLRGQLSKGKDGKKQNVTIYGKDYYSDATVWAKERHGTGLGRITDYITNYDSGNFYASLKVKTHGMVFEIDSDVPYMSDIMKRSGDIIMELDSDSLEFFSKTIVIPELQRRFNQKFNV